MPTRCWVGITICCQAYTFYANKNGTAAFGWPGRRQQMTVTRWRRLIWQRILGTMNPGTAVFISAVLLAAAIWAGLGTQSAIPVSTSPASDKPVFSLFFPKWSDVLTAGIPPLAHVTEQQKKEKATDIGQFSFTRILRDSVRLLTQIDIGDMRSVLRNQISMLETIKLPGSNGRSAIKRPTIQFKPKPTVTVSKPLVGIYHTHTSESFVPTTGVTHRKGGQAGEIVDVGTALVETLKKYGVQSVHSKDIHDYPSFMKAYGPSELTVKKMLADNPSIQIVLDIHRDAEKRENCIVEFNAIPMARIATIVAVGQEDLVQPHWQKNLEFAKQVNNKMNKYFPGLSRGIQTVDWRYNQHLHERALLFEVGSQETSLEEAERSMEILGGILVEILAENNNFGVRE